MGVAVVAAAADGWGCSRRNGSAFAVGTSVVDVAAVVAGAEVAAVDVGSLGSRSRSSSRDGRWVEEAPKDLGHSRRDWRRVEALEEEVQAEASTGGCNHGRCSFADAGDDFRSRIDEVGGCGRWYPWCYCWNC